MDCTETRTKLEPFLEGKLSGYESRSIRMHLSACSDCASALSGPDHIEALVTMDEYIEPSPDLKERFLSRLGDHRAQRASRESASRPWWNLFPQWSVSRQIVAVGALTALVVAGIYLGGYRPEFTEPAPQMADIAIAENLPLLEDLRVIENLDWLEDFESIEGLSLNSDFPPTVQ